MMGITPFMVHYSYFSIIFPWKIIFLFIYFVIPIIKFFLIIGGPKGFGHVVWKVKKHSNEGHTPHIVFTYYSVDGDQGMYNH